jgi:hypothetical protein
MNNKLSINAQRISMLSFSVLSMCLTITMIILSYLTKTLNLFLNIECVAVTLLFVVGYNLITNQHYRENNIRIKWKLIFLGAFVIGMLMYLVIPTTIIIAGLLLIFSVSLIFLYVFDVDLWILAVFVFALGNICACLALFYVSEAVIAFTGMGLFLIVLIICAVIEEKFKVIRGFIKKHNKYS